MTPTLAGSLVNLMTPTHAWSLVSLLDVSLRVTVVLYERGLAVVRLPVGAAHLPGRAAAPLSRALARARRLSVTHDARLLLTTHARRADGCKEESLKSGR